MKYILPCLLLMLLTGQQLFAQKYSTQFGVISNSEIELKEYAEDPEAEAVVLFDIGDSYFFDTDEGDYEIRFTRKKRIKVLKDAGAAYAEVSIPYYVEGYGRTESVEKIEAFTYNFMDGSLQKTPLDPSMIYDEQLSETWRVKKFTFPNVKEGSILDYNIVVETPFHFNLPDWEFQDRIPTIFSSYTVRMIPFYEYAFLAQGIKKFSYQGKTIDSKKRSFGNVIEVYGKAEGGGTIFQDVIYTYAMEDVPAFRDEDYITSINDYIMKIDFQLAKYNSPNGSSEKISTTWPEMIEDLMKHPDFGKYIKKCQKYTDDILKKEIRIGKESPEKKAKKIINYVKSNFTWDGSYARYSDKSVKAFLSQKEGSAATINLFLLALLQSAGIESYPVIISTRGHGRIKADYPFAHFFNDVILLVQMEDHTFLTDGTESRIAYNRIPPNCINERGLVVDENEVRWVELATSAQSEEKRVISLSPDPESLTAATSVSIHATEFKALYNKYHFNDSKDEIEEYLDIIGLTDISEIKTSNYDNPDRPYVIAAKGQTEIESVDEYILIAPFMGFPMDENALTQKTRTYPVDIIFPRSESFHTTIDIPEGYLISSSPEEFEMDNVLVDIKIEKLVTAEALSLNAHYKFKKAVYHPQNYSRIRSYFDTIIEKFNEKVVLSKL